MSDLQQSITEAFKEAERSAEIAAAKRAQRRKELLERKIETDQRIVAWVDILGFSAQLQKVRTDDEYRAVYRKLLFVHEVFDSPSASDEPETSERVNREYGRTVLALSDGLVITASLKAEARTSMTPYDLLMSFIGEILEAQANCAMNGIFLRGGICIGPFYYENNILLSPALVQAYRMETERACYPVIIVPQSHIAAIRELPGFKHYAKDAEPSQAYFRPFKSPSHRKGERLYHLDYLRFLASPDSHGFFSERERKESQDRDKYSPNERQMLFSLSHYRSAVRAVRRHKDKLLEAYHATKSQRVRAKYRWLIKYHNQTLQDSCWLFDEARIDPKPFTSFQAPARPTPGSARTQVTPTTPARSLPFNAQPPGAVGANAPTTENTDQ